MLYLNEECSAVSMSNEWTEWHLTPRGWEPGKSSLDFQPVRGPDKPPKDRVLSVQYNEHMGSAVSKVSKLKNEIWRSPDASAINSLLKEFGECPEQIHDWK